MTSIDTEKLLEIFNRNWPGKFFESDAIIWISEFTKTPIEMMENHLSVFKNSNVGSPKIPEIKKIIAAYFKARYAGKDQTVKRPDEFDYWDKITNDMRCNHMTRFEVIFEYYNRLARKYRGIPERLKTLVRDCKDALWLAGLRNGQGDKDASAAAHWILSDRDNQDRIRAYLKLKQPSFADQSDPPPKEESITHDEIIPPLSSVRSVDRHEQIRQMGDVP